MKRRLSRFKTRPLAPQDQPAIDAAWAAEADRRERELAEGHVTPVPLDAVLSRLRARLHNQPH